MLPGCRTPRRHAACEYYLGGQVSTLGGKDQPSPAVVPVVPQLSTTSANARPSQHGHQRLSSAHSSWTTFMHLPWAAFFDSCSSPRSLSPGLRFFSSCCFPQASLRQYEPPDRGLLLQVPSGSAPLSAGTGLVPESYSPTLLLSLPPLYFYPHPITPGYTPSLLCRTCEPLFPDVRRVCKRLGHRPSSLVGSLHREPAFGAA